MQASPLSLVSGATLPEYPIGRDERLDGQSFVKWHTARWLSSRSFKLMDWEAQGMARALFDLCQNESPVGTIPDDDDELAFMLRTDARHIRELRGLEFGPLRNWTRCVCNGEVRLMHPVVLQQVQDAIERRELAKLSRDDKAVSMRLARLRKGLLAAGLDKAVVADEILVGRIDQWLEENRRGNRTKETYSAAIWHAVQNRWIERGLVTLKD